MKSSHSISESDETIVTNFFYFYIKEKVRNMTARSYMGTLNNPEEPMEQYFKKFM